MKSKPAHELNKNDLSEISRKWLRKLKINPNRIQIMKMKNKWGSCSTKGNITLNSDLTLLPKEVAEYAVLHELLHFMVPNHGKTFKALLSAHMPNWEERHQKLLSLSHSYVLEKNRGNDR